MSTIAPAQPTTSPVPLALPDLYRINVHEYERIVAAGVLDDERIELIDGYLVKKMGKNPPHSWSTRRSSTCWHGFLPPGWFWRLEQPVRIPDFDEPEPDIAIVRGSNDDYKHRTPSRPTLLFWSRFRSQRWIAIKARSSRPMRRGTSPSTGSSTWSTARSRSTPGRARRLSISSSFHTRPGHPGRHRRPRGRPHRGRRHLALRPRAQFFNRETYHARR